MDWESTFSGLFTPQNVIDLLDRTHWIEYQYPYLYDLMDTIWKYRVHDPDFDLLSSFRNF